VPTRSRSSARVTAFFSVGTSADDESRRRRRRDETRRKGERKEEVVGRIHRRRKKGYHDARAGATEGVEKCQPANWKRGRKSVTRG